MYASTHGRRRGDRRFHGENTEYDRVLESFLNECIVLGQLTAPDRNALIARLNRVRAISENFGYGRVDFCAFSGNGISRSRS